MLATALYVRLTFCAPMAKKLKANSRIQILKKTSKTRFYKLPAAAKAFLGLKLKAKREIRQN